MILAASAGLDHPADSEVAQPRRSTEFGPRREGRARSSWNRPSRACRLPRRSQQPRG